MDSGIEISNSNYNIKNYKLSMDLIGGEKYTATIWGTVEDGKRYNARFGGDYNNVGFFNDNGDGTFSVTFIMPHSVGGDGLRNVINIFHYPSDISGTGTITKFKLENGNKATDWTPAIEDTEAEIQAVDNKLTTNMLKPTLGTITQNGVTCTNNGDGTYTLNGTASDWTSFYLPKIYFENGKKYKMIGCVGGNAETYYLEYSKSPWYICVNENGAIIEGTGEEVQILITCKPNSVLNNIVFKPMITTNLNATYDDFVPYTGSTGGLNGDLAIIN